MKRRPAIAIIFEEAGRGSSIPYISAFCKEGPASITLGPFGRVSGDEACSSRKVDLRLLVAVIGMGWMVAGSARRGRFAIQKDQRQMKQSEEGEKEKKAEFAWYLIT